ncbi:MAG: hypothetical protein IJW59_03705 [Clostridia bacterium]|nr:hypothetical protein [Clostridia bacterium]
MKRLLSLIILPLMAVAVLFGCGKDKNLTDVKNLYETMVTEYKSGAQNLFFADASSPNSIKIYYPDDARYLITENEYQNNDLEKRYKALDYQQKILTNIFKYYENNYEKFYTKASSMDKDEANSLYNKVKALKNSLDYFKDEYQDFRVDLKNGASNIMEYTITSYSFELNKVIDASFDFINYFHALNLKYAIENYDIHTAENIKIYVDKAYIDVSRIVYLENIKALNYQVGRNGVCDMAVVVGSENDFNLLDLLDERLEVSETIMNNLSDPSELGQQVKETLNELCYDRSVFEQKLNTYLYNYNALDIYTISQYKFDQMNGIDYESYLNTVNPSTKATIKIIENFISDTFEPYVEKLNKVVI